MDKEQFKVQVRHNRYMRSVVASACLIVIYSLIYITVIYAVLPIVLEQTKDGNLCNGLIIFLSVVYDVLVICEIVGKITQHKKLCKLEYEFFHEEDEELNKKKK